MDFKHFGIIILVLSVAWSCQQSGDKQEDNTQLEQASPMEQEQSSAPSQQLPGQPQQQGGEVTDKELQQFVAASEYVQVVNQQTQQTMVSTIEETGLGVQRYNEIQQAQQDPNQDADATDQELKQFETATQELQEIQVQAQQQLEEKLNEEGLTENRFQEIGRSLQRDPELQEKFRAIQEQKTD